MQISSETAVRTLLETISRVTDFIQNAQLPPEKTGDWLLATLADICAGSLVAAQCEELGRDLTEPELVLLGFDVHKGLTETANALGIAEPSPETTAELAQHVLRNVWVLQNAPASDEVQ